MPDLLTAAQMRAIEQAAIDSGAVTGLELMERAGRGVIEAIFEEWPELARSQRGPAPAPPEYFENNKEGPQPFRAVILCGPGNNGGDGFVVARLLQERGWEVEVFLYGDPHKLPPDARATYDAWCETGEVRDLLDGQAAASVVLPPDSEGVLVDAIFGTGLSRVLDAPLRIALSEFLSCVPVCFLRKVAIDVASGLCSDSGRYLLGEHDHGGGHAYDLTVTFHRARVGHYLGAQGTRAPVVVDIGLDALQTREIHAKARMAVAELVEAQRQGKHPKELIDSDAEKAALAALSVGLPGGAKLIDGADALLNKGEVPEAHKYAHGHALILSGPMGRSGAARLAARGALRIGAGLVTVGAPGSAMMECATQLTAIMLRRCNDAEGLAALLEDVRLNALCLGPGLGVGDTTCALVSAALAAKRATVLDADALTSFADNPRALFDALHPGAVLTPHGGEFARLFPDIAAELAALPIKGPAYSKVDATRAAAARAGCTVLFKGPDTVIASPDGRCAINAAMYDRTAPWLATAGSGDALAGIITGLLARGFDPQMAAESGAWLHVEAARAFGPGLIAEDLPEMLPQVFRDLGLE